MLTGRLADSRLGHRGASPHRALSLAPQVNISWYSMPWCRVFTQGSSPAQFRASSRSLSLPMSVDEPACIFVFWFRCSSEGAWPYAECRQRGQMCLQCRLLCPGVVQLPRSFTLHTSACFLVMCRVAGLIGPGRLPAFGQGRLDSRASVHRWHPLAQQAVG